MDYNGWSIKKICTAKKLHYLENSEANRKVLNLKN